MLIRNLNRRTSIQSFKHAIMQSCNHATIQSLPGDAWMHGCMRLLRNNIILLFVSLILFSACDKGPPIPEEKFIKVYTDLLIIQDTTNTAAFSLDSIKTFVFRRHNISSEQYDETISYYNSHPDKWITFFDSATSYVTGLREEAEN